MSWQGVDIAIAAMDRLRDIPHLELLIAGDGPERGHLESLAADLGLAERIRFLGYVPRDQALAVINGFDVALAPFTRERNAEIGLSPIKIRDYAAAGRIVVAADIEGVRELSEAGWLFPHVSDDADDLARVIRRVIAIPETGTGGNQPEGPRLCGGSISIGAVFPFESPSFCSPMPSNEVTGVLKVGSA